MLAAIEVEDYRGAVEILMKRYGAQVYQFLRQSLRDEALAEDVQQRVFIQAYRDLRRFERRSRVRTWLYSIARHRMLDASKSRRRADAHIVQDDATKVPDPRPEVGQRLDDERLREALAECVDQLPEPIRSAVLLRFQRGLSFEEMAEILREKPGTLQARVSRALPALRACIRKRTGGTV